MCSHFAPNLYGYTVHAVYVSTVYCYELDMNCPKCDEHALRAVMYRYVKKCSAVAVYIMCIVMC